MQEGMHKRNITILDGDDEITHWTGSPAQSGGALKGINMGAPAGPPTFSYDTTGKDREQMKFDCDMKILGMNEAAQEAVIAKYAKGTEFPNASISGLPAADWIVENAIVKHNDNDQPSILSITLAETGPATVDP